MENELVYNLKGLRRVWLGMWLELLASIGNGVFNGVNTSFQLVEEKYQAYVSLGLSFLLLIGFLMILSGLKKVREYSHRFQKSRSAMIWAVILAILFVVVLVGFIAVVSTMDATRVTGTIVLVVMVVCALLLLLAGIFSLLGVVHLMGGCGEVARKNDDKHYGRKCTTTWVLYVLGILIFIVLAGFMLYAMGNSFVQAVETRGGQINSLSDLRGGLDQVYWVVAGLLATIVYLFIINLMVIGKVHGTYLNYHGLPLHIDPEESPYLDPPEMEVKPAPATPQKPEEPAEEIPEPTLVLEEKPAPAEEPKPELTLDPSPEPKEEMPKPNLSFFDETPEDPGAVARSSEMTQTLAELPPLSKKPEEK